MRLTEIDIEGYRSVAGKLTIRVQEELTCLIGANESGKSNILEAIPILAEAEFAPFDKNSASKNTIHPRLTYTVRLNSTDRRQFLGAIGDDVSSLGTPEDNSVSAKTLSALKSIKEFFGGNRKLLRVQVTKDGSRRLLFGGGWVALRPINDRVPALSSWFEESVPRIVLFDPTHELADSVSLQELEDRKNLPFEGLLKLAGVWERRDGLFTEDLAAHRLHDSAGRILTRRIRKKWSQGAGLHFQFHYEGSRLAIRTKDPVTFDAPSFRSLGFRSFLSFYLTLYAETEELDPEGFILLFDEPGLHLHPQGQKDLLRELRALSERNQVLYATHSPFLIDRNDLPSILLVTKGTTKKERGTQVVYKPYGNNWRRLTDALGIVPADAFFPPDKTLLVEGTSDRIYITVYMRLMADELKVDLNFLSIIDADRRDEIPGVVRMLVGADRHIVVAADGDKGGRDFEKHLRKLIGRGKMTKLSFLDLREISGRDSETAIEDLLPEEPWFRAVDQYVGDVLESDHKVDRTDVRKRSAETTRAMAAAAHLVDHGVLDKKSRFSRTMVAHLLAEDEIERPDKDAPMARLCEAIVKALKIQK